MSGDNKLFSTVSSALFSPGSLTKKSPKTIRYDPINHERILYSNESGVMKKVSPSATGLSVFRSSSQSLDPSPYQSLNTSGVTAQGRGPLARSGYFSLSSSPSLANMKYAKTRARDEYANPITGTKEFLDASRAPVESLGREPRVVANQSRFSSSDELRAAFNLCRGESDKITGAKRKPVQSVAYVNLYDLRT